MCTSRNSGGSVSANFRTLRWHREKIVKLKELTLWKEENDNLMGASLRSPHRSSPTSSLLNSLDNVWPLDKNGSIGDGRVGSCKVKS